MKTEMNRELGVEIEQASKITRRSPLKEGAFWGPLMLSSLMRENNWKRFGCRDLREYLVKANIPDDTARDAACLMIQNMFFTSRARAALGREKVNEIGDLLSNEPEQYSFEEFLSRLHVILAPVLPVVEVRI